MAAAAVGAAHRTCRPKNAVRSGARRARRRPAPRGAAPHGAAAAAARAGAARSPPCGRRGEAQAAAELRLRPVRAARLCGRRRRLRAAAAAAHEPTPGAPRPPGQRTACGAPIRLRARPPFASSFCRRPALGGSWGRVKWRPSLPCLALPCPAAGSRLRERPEDKKESGSAPLAQDPPRARRPGAGGLPLFARTSLWTGVPCPY